ncbi:MAG: hypothetical protein Q8O56_07750 [Solirubrobacteraceae bacterium]|nr:hypothetical protein [Solirubrobacteraceae bacterium]
MSAHRNDVGGGTIAAESLLLGIAEGLTGKRCPRASLRLRQLAGHLPEPAVDPLDDLVAVAALMRSELRPRPDGGLLLPDVLRAGVGHPAAIVVAAAAAARARGMLVAVVGHGPRTWLAHERPCEPFIVDPIEPDGLVDGRTLGVDLHWRCAHDLALGTLDLIVARGERAGDLCGALAAARLRCELATAHGRAVDDAVHELRRLRARLN